MEAVEIIENIEVVEEISEIEEVTISSLNKDMQYRQWAIEGLVITKSEMRTFDRADEPCGEMFCFTIRDDTGDIEVAVFDHKEAHRYFNLIHLNKKYFITNCKVIDKNIKYNLTEHNFELEFSNVTLVEFLGDGPGEFRPFDYPSVPIDSIDFDDGIGSSWNILGICVSHTPLTIKKTAFGREAYLREIYVIDQSGEKIKIDLWDHEAKKFDISGNPIVYLYGARLKEYRGVFSLRTVMNTMLLVLRDFPGARDLRNWHAHKGIAVD